jgi:hypothetical protein
MTTASRDDARVLIELARLRLEQGVPEALSWFWGDDVPLDYASFVAKYPRGSREMVWLHRIADFADFVGTLWKHGLLDEALLFDAFAFHYGWLRIHAVLRGIRARAGQPDLWAHYQALAEAQAARAGST